MKPNCGKVLFIIVFCMFLVFSISSCLRQEQKVEPIIVSEPTEDFSREIQTETVEVNNEPSLVSLGEFKLTAYCSCDICCNGFAYNRPKDEYGNEIVYGSIGERLTTGVSVAVDPSVIPYGTELIINEHTYIAQDTGGAIDGNHIDIYMSDHQEALNFGVQTAEVYVKNN